MSMDGSDGVQGSSDRARKSGPHEFKLGGTSALISVRLTQSTINRAEVSQRLASVASLPVTLVRILQACEMVLADTKKLVTINCGCPAGTLLRDNRWARCLTYVMQV